MPAFPALKALWGKTDHDMVWHSEAEKYRADDKEVTDSGKPKLYYEEEQTTPTGSRRLLRTSKIPPEECRRRYIRHVWSL